MPDPDAPSGNEPSRGESGDSPSEPRNLPVPVPRSSEVAHSRDESWIGRVLRTIFGWKPASIRADLEVVLQGASGENGFSPEEGRMLRNILGLRGRRIEDIMVPRADIVAVQQAIGVGELVRVFERAGHSRLVVYDDTLDDPVGMVHIRDLIAFLTARAAVPSATNTKRKKPLPAGLDLRSIDLAMPLTATKIVRPILFVPPSMPAIDLLAKMQATHIHLALVIDEYGGSEGLVSIEDIVEEIVGEIEDEHDEATIHTVVREPDGSFLADARAGLEDVMRTVGTDFDVGAASEEVDTLGGYLVAQLGRVPVRGELVPGPGPFEIEVLDADPRRVKKVKISISRNRRRSAARELRRREAESAEAEQSGPAPTAPSMGEAEAREASSDTRPESSATDGSTRQP